MNDPTVQSIGRAHNKSAAQVALRWLVQQDLAVVTSSDSEAYDKADLDIFDFVLSETEMNELAAVDSSATTATSSSSEDVQVVAHLRLPSLDALSARFWAVSSPSDPAYGEFASLAEMTDMLNVTAEQVERVRSWFLDTLDARDVTVSALRDTVTGTVTLSMPETTLHAQRPDDDVAFLVVRRPRVVTTKLPHKASPLTSSSSSLSAYTVKNIKRAYGIDPDHVASNPNTLQMVWGRSRARDITRPL